MLREIINTNSDNYILELPEELKNRDVEIIAFPIDKVEEKKVVVDEKAGCECKKTREELIASIKKTRPGFGSMEGMINMDRFDEPLEEFEEYM